MAVENGTVRYGSSVLTQRFDCQTRGCAVSGRHPLLSCFATPGAPTKVTVRKLCQWLVEAPSTKRASCTFLCVLEVLRINVFYISNNMRATIHLFVPSFRNHRFAVKVLNCTPE